jgi:hypothetical protein
LAGSSFEAGVFGGDQEVEVVLRELPGQLVPDVGVLMIAYILRLSSFHPSLSVPATRTP